MFSFTLAEARSLCFCQLTCPNGYSFQNSPPCKDPWESNKPQSIEAMWTKKVQTISAGIGATREIQQCPGETVDKAAIWNSSTCWKIIFL